MPDVLEMPYRPPLRDGYEAGEQPYTYRLSSNTCLAGDVIGDYSFKHPLSVGDKLYFEDMAIYSMVKKQYVQRYSAAGDRGDRPGRQLPDRQDIRV